MTIDEVECPFCWDTGTVMFQEMDQDGNTYPVPRPCPEGCLTPDEVPY